MSTDRPNTSSLDHKSLETLIELGFNKTLATQALTLNDNVDSAVSWMLDHPNGIDIEVPVVGELSSEEFPPISVKMVMVVRTDLGMTPGKIAAQCVHAALGAYRIAVATNLALSEVWEDSGEKAVCLKCRSEEEILTLQAMATQLGLINYLVSDAGRTQITEGSRTVLAIGPASEEHINQVTGSLKLY